MKKLIAATTAIAVSSTFAATADAAQHKVKAGDSLWSISQTYGTSVGALKAENGLSSNLIVPNQVLNINEKAKSTAVKTTAQTKSQTTSSVYKIVPGDTLGKIGQKFGVSVAQLKAWNNLSSDLIIAGKTLKVKGAAVAVQAPVQAQTYSAPAAPKKVYTAPKTYQAPAATYKAPTAPKTATRTTSYSSGQNWAALAACESGGNAGIVDASGTYHGLYQFDLQTWRSVGGSGLPSQASAAEQTKRAQILYSQRGSQPWPVCGARL